MIIVGGRYGMETVSGEVYGMNIAKKKGQAE
jgi:hypothetical protein